MALERRERVADLVREHRRHLAERGEPPLVREPLDELLALADEVEEEEGASDERRQGDHGDPERPRGEPFDLTGLERLELDEEPARTGRRRTAVTVSPEKASVPPRLRWRTARIPRWPPEGSSSG